MSTAYNWTRELSPDRLRQLDVLKSSWRHLFGEPDDRGHYARIQWCGWGKGTQYFKTFDATIEGKSVKVHLLVVTARQWFAREAYNRALAATRERYPDFEVHHFIDGDRIGERRICFESESNALSTSFLHHQLWHIITNQGLEISETWFSAPCDWYGYTANQVDSEAHHQIDEGHLRFTVVRAVEQIEENLLERIADEIRTCGFPKVSSDKLKFDWDDIKDDLIELSDSELVALNWADARPVLAPVDLSLQRAVTRLDLEGIRNALTEGANPNLTDRGGDNNLCAIIQAWGDHLMHHDAPEKDLDYYGGPRPERKISIEEIKEMLQVLIDAGAHPNYYVCGAVPAIVDAVLSQKPEIVRLLLDCGADPSVSPFWDGGPGETPAAWDYASTDGFALDEYGARECYYAMVKNHPAPFGSRSSEAADRREADLPDHLRSWRRDS